VLHARASFRVVHIEGSTVPQTTREPRAEKVAVVEEVQARLDDASAAILTEYRGLPVSEMENLRRALRAAGGEYKIYKNTLVRRAVQDGSYQALESLLEGPTAIAFVRDDVAAVAKVLRDFSRQNPALVVKGGLIGSSLFDARAAQALADLPSREALLAQIAGLLAAPMQRFASLLAAVPQRMAYALSALVEQRQAAGETLAAPAEQASEPAAEVAQAEVADATAEEATDSAVEEVTAPEPTAESAPDADAAVDTEAAEGGADSEVSASDESGATSEDAAPADSGADEQDN
jgi:large subunit ribosomal protein L10